MTRTLRLVTIASSALLLLSPSAAARQGHKPTGTATLSFYCSRCQGGTHLAMPGRKFRSPGVAANWLPLGSVVWIEGVGRRVVDDRGGAGLSRRGRFDVRVSRSGQCNRLGIRTARYRVIRRGRAR